MRMSDEAVKKLTPKEALSLYHLDDALNRIQEKQDAENREARRKQTKESSAIRSLYEDVINGRW
jgi:hypothetical protein